MKLRNKKTGNIYTLSENLYIEYTQGGKIEVRAIIPGGNMSYYYDSLDKLNEDWKDVKEPLIKDPKIRKAVRAWADANDIEDGITYLGDGEFRSYLNTTIDFAILVDEHRFDLLKKSEEYTVTELCGEEG